MKYMLVELNRAASIAEAGDTAAALAIADRLDLDGYHLLHATRAELLGRRDEARAAYGRALELVGSEPERRFLERRLAELGEGEEAAALTARRHRPRPE